MIEAESGAHRVESSPNPPFGGLCSVAGTPYSCVAAGIVAKRNSERLIKRNSCCSCIWSVLIKCLRLVVVSSSDEGTRIHYTTSTIPGVTHIGHTGQPYPTGSFARKQYERIKDIQKTSIPELAMFIACVPVMFGHTCFRSHLQ